MTRAECIQKVLKQESFGKCRDSIYAFQTMSGYYVCSYGEHFVLAVHHVRWSVNMNTTSPTTTRIRHNLMVALRKANYEFDEANFVSNRFGTLNSFQGET